MSAIPSDQPTKANGSGGGLTRVERFNVRLVERWHSVPALSRAANWLGRNLARREIELILHNILEDHHFERLAEADFDNGVIVCANHRSYLDNFAVAVRAMPHMPKDVRMIAPARTEGLFDKPWGILINFFITGMNMYPPVVRTSRGAMWGKRVIQILSDLMRGGRAAIFIHPEGGRNKGTDPYHLMPAKPGLGKIIHSTRCDVFPVFLQGFPREPGAFLKANLRRGQPLVHAVMGEPLDFSAERALPPSPEIYREIGRRLMAAIAELSKEELEIRARRSIPSSTETRGS